jgi:hypothetical protein
MKITRENYEIWFLDYLEERLTPEEQELVRLFVLDHPDLAEELEAFVPLLTSDEKLVYPYKEQLKRSPFEDDSYLEHQLIAAMEGDLEEQEQLKLDQWLATRPEHRDVAQLLYQCRLHSDPAILFPHKGRLKKKTTLTGNFSRIAAAAAVLLLALLLFYPREKGVVPEMNPSAELFVRVPEVDRATSPAVQANPPVMVAINRAQDERHKSAPASEYQTKKIVADAALLPDRPQVANEPLQPKIAEATMLLTLNDELEPLKVWSQSLPANNELPISDYLKGRARELRALDDHELISRNKVVIAGLKFMAKLTGNNLTGKKGEDGRLRTISFNTQLLAVSIPVNRSL